MTYIIKSTDELEELINNREYVDNLSIYMNENISHLLCNLTDLKCLKFGFYYNQLTDLSYLSNLQCLKFGSQYNQDTKLSLLSNLEFGYHYNQPTDLLHCINLHHLQFGHCYNQQTDLSKCVKLEKLDDTEIEELDLSTYRNGIFKKN